nr:hypothetical protein [Tanacetum cinerariifolium]
MSKGYTDENVHTQRAELCTDPMHAADCGLAGVATAA